LIDKCFTEDKIVLEFCYFVI